MDVPVLSSALVLRGPPLVCPPILHRPFRRPTQVSVLPRLVVAAFNIRLGSKSCGKCGGKGAVECPGCKGSGRNKQNGNLFERWKCFNCQGFGLVSCPKCGKGGLTPEQRGER